MRSRMIFASVLLAFIAFAMGAATAMAQDPVKVAPAIYKVIFENEQVRVFEVRVKAGEKVGKHSHPDHLVYSMGPFKVRFSKPDGTSNDADFKAGDVVWGPAETHWAENIGTTEANAIVVELKGPAKAAPKAEKKKM